MEAVLTGRTIADLVRNAFVVLVMLVVGLLVGFRPDAGPGGWVAAMGLLLLLSFAFSWIGATIGLLVRSIEAVQSAGFIWLFPSPSPAAPSSRPTACRVGSRPSPTASP
ncbi:MAG: ABC transporter permease [Actinomycetota bacterium]|nr:ABC transporter permease [Actinomycetota bacterium]